jgi:hypothetical protein
MCIAYLVKMLRKRNAKRLLNQVLAMRKELQECKLAIRVLEDKEFNRAVSSSPSIFNVKMPERPWHC